MMNVIATLQNEAAKKFVSEGRKLDRDHRNLQNTG